MLAGLDVVLVSLHSRFDLPPDAADRAGAQGPGAPGGQRLLPPHGAHHQPPQAGGDGHGPRPAPGRRAGRGRRAELQPPPPRPARTTTCSLAKELGCKIVIDTDSHRTRELDLMRYGRRAGPPRGAGAGRRAQYPAVRGIPGRDEARVGRANRPPAGTALFSPCRTATFTRRHPGHGGRSPSFVHLLKGLAEGDRLRRPSARKLDRSALQQVASDQEDRNERERFTAPQGSDDGGYRGWRLDVRDRAGARAGGPGRRSGARHPGRAVERRPAGDGGARPPAQGVREHLPHGVAGGRSLARRGEGRRLAAGPGRALLPRRHPPERLRPRRSPLERSHGAGGALLRALLVAGRQGRGRPRELGPLRPRGVGRPRRRRPRDRALAGPARLAGRELRQAAPDAGHPQRPRLQVFRPTAKEPIVFSAGRLEDEAGNLEALEAVAPRLSWPVFLAGENHHSDGGEARPHHTRLLGKLSQRALAAWLGRASIYCLPARYEPFGLSALEAALSGCALVLGDVPSLREVWKHRAVFVPPNDPEALEDALTRLIEDPERRASLAAGARARALQLTPERMVDGYLAAYQDVLAAEPRRRVLRAGGGVAPGPHSRSRFFTIQRPSSSARILRIPPASLPAPCRARRRAATANNKE